jgi:hypothetical protein
LALRGPGLLTEAAALAERWKSGVLLVSRVLEGLAFRGRLRDLHPGVLRLNPFGPPSSDMTLQLIL